MAVAAAGCGGTTEPAKSRASRGDAQVAPELARKLQGVLDQQRKFYELPGAAAAVVMPGRGSWSGGSGVADRQSGARVTAWTTFEIASITKAFVGALTLKLAQEGRVSLDEKLSDTVPGWPYADRITLRHLLAHTSGVSRFDDLGSPVFRAVDRDHGAYWSPRRVLRYARRPSFAPGARWEYNNANYLLAGLVLEHATHEPVQVALRREILDPLGVRDVVLQPQEHPRPGAAHGYGPAGGGREHDLSDGSGFVPYRSVASASWTAGGMVASAPAVARFGDAVLRGDLLGHAARRKMTTFSDTGGGPGYTAYALGMGVIYMNRISDRPVWAAVGSTAGFGSTLAHVPETGITVAVLANRDDSTALTGAIAETLIDAATDTP